MIEDACELVEQIIPLRGEIALIEVVADDEFLKGDFGEVGGKGAVTPDARDTDRLRRYGVEPVKSRKHFAFSALLATLGIARASSALLSLAQQFGDLEGCKSESLFAEAADKLGVVSVSDLQTRPTEKAKCLYLVGGKGFCDKLESVSELLVGKLVPALRHGEVDM